MLQKMLKVTEVGEEKEASNGRRFRTLKFVSFDMLPNGTPVFTNQGVGTRNVFSDFTDKDGTYFKADGIWTGIKENQIKPGSLVQGQIVKYHTSPYAIDSSPEVTSYSAVVFSNEIPVEYCNKQLKDSFACVVIDGVLTNPQQTQKPGIAEAISDILATNGR